MWVDGAGLAIKSEKAIIRQLERKFSGYGIAHSVARETVTGKSRPEVEIEATDRGKRASTEEATAMAMESEGPKSQVGKNKSRKTKKSEEAERLLPLLFDIALPDDVQTKAALPFLQDQRTERKCRLPPVTRPLGVEKRRMEREAKEDERKKREEVQKEARFKTVG